MSTITRSTALDSRHRALGSDLSQSWNGLPIPQNYASNPYDEVTATRSRAGLIEVTGLNIFKVGGPEATKFLNYLLTTDVSKAEPGDSHISNTVNDAGALIDDVLVYVDGNNHYRISHGGGAFGDALKEYAPKYDVSVERDDDVHILSLQGPAALDVLSPHTPAKLADLGYFRHLATTLFDRPVSIARGGYSGERGYEVFTSRADAGLIWDKILEAGKAHGVVPASWTCLDIVRVESGLLFFPFDMPHGNTTPWEVRADWTVDLNKPDFRGKGAVAASKGKERSLITGLEVESSEAVTPGAKVFANGREVGVVTSTVFSQHLMKSLAMAQIVPAQTALGTSLEIQEGGKALNATVVQMPFYDPLRLRTHPSARP